MRDQEGHSSFLVKTWFRELFLVVMLKGYQVAVLIVAPLLESAGVLVRSYSLTKHQRFANNSILNSIKCITLPPLLLQRFHYLLLKISITQLHREVTYLKPCLQHYMVAVGYVQDLRTKQRQKI